MNVFIPLKLIFIMEQRQILENLAKRRFIYTPSAEIYGGIAGFYDFGPVGSMMMSNLIDFWRNFFIIEEDLLQIDTRLITPEAVFIASGHVSKFDDKAIKDKITGKCYRADHLVKDHLEKMITTENQPELNQILARIDNYSSEELDMLIKKYQIKSPETGNDLGDTYHFNLMFDCQIGPTGKQKGYLRPETAQGMFVNFLKLAEYHNHKLPFGAAQIGPAFRNEISPRNNLLRVREFALAEIEYFVDPSDKSHPKFGFVKDTVLPLYSRESQLTDQKVRMMAIGEAVANHIVDNETLGYFLVKDYQFLVKVGIKPEKIRFRQHLPNEMAHYASDCWDVEILTSYGWIECVGNADRACYDLSVHEKSSGIPMTLYKQFDKPKEVQIMIIKPNKKLIAETFRPINKDDKQTRVKEINQFLEKIKDDQEKIKLVKNAIDSNGIYDYHGYHLNKEMLGFETVTKFISGEPIQPSVIEPSFGLNRILYSILEHNIWVRSDSGPHNELERTVLSVPYQIAAYKCAILPLMCKPELTMFVERIDKMLKQHHISCKADVSGVSIGKRYSRMDELGVPFAITIDYQTLDDNTVTIRERDTMVQKRIKMENLMEFLKNN